MRVIGDQRCVLGDCLRDKQVAERVAMVCWKFRQFQKMGVADLKRNESFAREGVGYLMGAAGFATASEAQDDAGGHRGPTSFELTAPGW